MYRLSSTGLEILKEGTKINQRRKGQLKQEHGKRKGFKRFLREEEGMGTVEIILIIVVLIGLVIIFKTQLRSLLETIFDKITKDSKTVMS